MTPSPKPERAGLSGIDAGTCAVLLLAILIVGSWMVTRFPASTSVAEPHAAGPTSIVSLGGDRLHAQALIEDGGTLRIFLLGSDAARVVETEQQALIAYVKSSAGISSTVQLVATPQRGDAEGHTSQYVGELSNLAFAKDVVVEIVVPNFRVGRERFHLAFDLSNNAHDSAMPAKIRDEDERKLYLTPAGRYTEADIAGNGYKTASEKFARFQAKHDFRPQPGDAVCPITRTKANPACTWIVDGHEYQFCCPPCIDEFVRQAKEQPGELRQPQHYVH